MEMNWAAIWLWRNGPLFVLRVYTQDQKLQGGNANKALTAEQTSMNIALIKELMEIIVLVVYSPPFRVFWVKCVILMHKL